MPTGYISFEPIEWTQEIRDFRKSDVDGRYLTAKCRPATKCNLLLDGKVDVRNFATIPLGIIDGQLTAEELEESRLSKESLGGFFYVDNNDLHGWFFLKKPDSYTAVWDQIRDGGYSECSITLGVSPVQYRSDDLIWNVDQPLSIKNVSLQFKRKTNVNKPTDQAAARTGLFGSRMPARR
jgi:hypothetical protein